MNKQTFEIIDGAYVGPSIWEGHLDLREYKDTLTSLGDLKEVGKWLNLDGCTSLSSLGSLKKVGHWLILGGGFFFFKRYKKKYFITPSLPLHEALNALHTNEVCRVPLYKNILLQKLQGG